MPTKYQTVRGSLKNDIASGANTSAKRPAMDHKRSAAAQLSRASNAKSDRPGATELAGQGITFQEAHDRMLKHLDESFKRLA